MMLRRARYLCLIASAAAIAACDPQALVKQKVPGPLKSALTWSESAQPQKPGVPVAIEVTLKIVTPENEAFFATDQAVAFRVNVLAKGGTVPDNELSWTVTDEKTKQQTMVGKGRAVERKLPAGMYAVEVAYPASGDKKVGATAKIRVGPAAQGAVVSKGAGLADVELVLTDPAGKNVISRVKSNQAGVFYVEIPAQGDYRLTPHKQGFSFSPVFRVARRGSKPEELAFQAARAQIGGLRLTASAESEDALSVLCPEQTAFVKATVSGEAPLKRLDAFLVSRTKGPGHPPTLIGTAEFPEDSAEPAQPTVRVVKVQIPPAWTEEFFGDTYGLVVTAHDAKGDSWSAETTHPMKADVAVCLDRKCSEAAELQARGDFETALKEYDLIADLQKPLGHAGGFSGVLEKALFNRGLINLRSALELERGSLRRSAFLTRAASDFQEVSRLHRKDAEASFLAGVSADLKGDRDAAIESYQVAIKGDPGFADAYEFRARALIETRRAGNLSRAVDDCTHALGLNPEEKGLRAVRKVALQLDVASQDLPPDAAVDTSSVPLEPIEKRLNLGKFRR